MHFILLSWVLITHKHITQNSISALFEKTQSMSHKSHHPFILQVFEGSVITADSPHIQGQVLFSNLLYWLGEVGILPYHSNSCCIVKELIWVFFQLLRMSVPIMYLWSEERSTLCHGVLELAYAGSHEPITHTSFQIRVLMLRPWNQ